jgi:hypothetical protein
VDRRHQRGIGTQVGIGMQQLGFRAHPGVRVLRLVGIGSGTHLVRASFGAGEAHYTPASGAIGRASLAAERMRPCGSLLPALRCGMILRSTRDPLEENE